MPGETSSTTRNLATTLARSLDLRSVSPDSYTVPRCSRQFLLVSTSQTHKYPWLLLHGRALSPSFGRLRSEPRKNLSILYVSICEGAAPRNDEPPLPSLTSRKKRWMGHRVKINRDHGEKEAWIGGEKKINKKGGGSR